MIITNDTINLTSPQTNSFEQTISLGRKETWKLVMSLSGDHFQKQCVELFHEELDFVLNIWHLNYHKTAKE